MASVSSSYPIYEEIRRGAEDPGSRGEAALHATTTTEFPEYATPMTAHGDSGLLNPALRPLILRPRPSQTISIKTAATSRSNKHKPISNLPRSRTLHPTKRSDCGGMSRTEDSNPKGSLQEPLASLGSSNPRLLNPVNQLTSFQPSSSRKSAKDDTWSLKEADMSESTPTKDGGRDFNDSDDCKQALLS